ncbi:MAG TPA: RluA family pseudouridine synthase [Bacteroidales bacterium]|nr:RluA family pseudouridine synthase [Bacteroidales bacterium]
MDTLNTDRPKSGKDNTKKSFNAGITQFLVDEECRLLEFLMKKFPEKSRNKLKSWLKNKNVEISNSVETSATKKLSIGDKVEVFQGRIHERKDLCGIKIFYEDDYIIVIEKPCGVLSVPAYKEEHTSAYNILSDYVKRKNNRKIYPVHRLDGRVSGVMMFALKPDIQLILKDNWKEMVFERKYIAVTSGALKKKDGTISSYLAENKMYKVYSTNDTEKGKLAITNYKTIKTINNYSLLEVKLDTGRKNQIRVQLSDIGAPIVGDEKYGSNENPFGRIGLHAWILGVIHPVSKEKMRFESKIPEEFQKLFK